MNFSLLLRSFDKETSLSISNKASSLPNANLGKVIKIFLTLLILISLVIFLSKASTAQAAENPHWKILVLIYRSTDFSYTDNLGSQHRVVASMTQEEVDRATQAATRFFEVDVPALTSGNMYPVLTIRYPSRTLTQLDPFCGFWPSAVNTAPERDPAFDSVVVIWDGSGVDLITSQPAYLQNCGGLTQPTGTGQTYSTFQVDSVSSDQRNIFKHEWGHSILWYFEAAGTAPQPAVNNHINNTDTRYVHCPTGEVYILQDETDNNPIPNSIYNSTSGFTHDYYSGTTAKPETPTQCLGITPEAWASGGPVTKPGGQQAIEIIETWTGGMIDFSEPVKTRFLPGELVYMKLHVMNHTSQVVDSIWNVWIDRPDGGTDYHRVNSSFGIQSGLKNIYIQPYTAPSNPGQYTITAKITWGNGQYQVQRSTNFEVSESEENLVYLPIVIK